MQPISHEPAGYDCPFCGFLSGRQSDFNNENDIVARNDKAVAFMCPMTWPKNHGNVIVIPKDHIENIYNLPKDQVDAVFALVQSVAAAMRGSYGCSGVTIVQRNEPDAGQHVWHLHIHVVPRYADDQFSEADQTEFAADFLRAPFARKLRDYLSTKA